MTAATPGAPIYKAGLTKWAMPFDRSAGARSPQVPDEPGPIHAVRPLRRELGIREPHFIEDTGDYRAALCGAKVKIIMPNTFKPEEDEACVNCIAESRNPTGKVLMHPGGGPAYNFGDRWSPGRRRRKRGQRNSVSRL